MRIRYLGWKNIGSGINIPDPQNWILLCKQGPKEYLAINGTLKGPIIN